MNTHHSSTRSTRWLARAVGGTTCVLLWSVMSTAQIPGLLGRASLASGDLDYELQSAAATPDGKALWFVASAHAKGQVRGGTLVLAAVDARNDITQSSLTLDAPDKPAEPVSRSARRQLVDGMAFDSRGDLLIQVGRGATPPAIVRVQLDSRRVEAPRPLQLTTSNSDVHKIVRLTDGRVLALGNADDKLFAAELADNGRMVWQKSLAAESGFVEMAASTFDGGAVVLARHGQDVASAQIWIGKLSSKGELERAITVPGRTGSAAALREGGYAIVTSQAGARGFDVTLRLFGPDMRERSSSPIVKDQVNPEFAVVAAPRGGFLVAGTKDRGLWVSQFGADGRAIWTETRTPTPPEAEMVFNLRLLSVGDTFFLPYTAFTLDGREQRQSIRVLKFQAR